METVTSAVVADDKVAVNTIALPEFSTIDEEAALKVTVGALSSSVIVIDALCVPLSVAEPPDTAVIATAAASFPS